MPTIEERSQEITKLFPDKLYKYQGPNLNFIKNTLIENNIFFSMPSKFNDPFDCRLCVNTEATEQQKKNLLKLFMERKNPNWGKLTLEINMKRAIKNNAHIKISQADPIKEMDRTGIACFTTQKDNLLMWSHYASKHQGICFEFTPKLSSKLFMHIGPVHYSNKTPIWDLYTSTEEQGQITDIVYTKSEEWKYEQEWRIWLTEGPGNHSFEPNQLTSLILGCRADKKFIDDIRKLIHEREPNIELFQARPIYGQYALEICQI